MKGLDINKISLEERNARAWLVIYEDWCISVTRCST